MNDKKVNSIESWRQTVLESALDAVVGIDSSDLVIDWNKKAQEIFGYSKEEAIGKCLTSLVIPTDFREAHLKGVEYFLKTGIGPILNKRIELEALRKDGSIFPVELTVIPVKTEGSYLFYSFIRDISEKKLTEKDLLLKSEVLEYSLNGIDIVDSAGNFIYANRAYLKMWGYENIEEIIGTSAANHCADPSVPLKIISTLKSQGECDIEFVAKRKDGSVFDVRMWARLGHDPQGREIYPSTSVDITEQKRIREALIANEEQYHLTFEKAPVGIVNTAPDGKLLRVNEKLCSLLGYTYEELTKLSFVDITHPDDRALDLELFDKMRTQKIDIYDREKRYKKKDGSYIWVKVTGQMLLNSNGSPKHSVTIVQDISARKKAEERQKILEDQLIFLSEISKELLSEPLGLKERLDKLVHAVVPKLADWCVVDFVNEEKLPYIAAVAHRDPNKVQLAFDLREKYPPRSDRPTGAPRVIKTGSSELVKDVSVSLLKEIVYDEDHLKILQNLGLRSFMCVPIKAHGEILGALTLVSEKSSYVESDLKFAQDLANRAALAIYNSQLFKQTQDAVKLRDEFISIASHELNTPLTSMSMQFQMAERLIEKEDHRVYEKELVKKRVRITNAQLRRMMKLISDMLDVSRITYGKLPIEYAELSINTILSTSVEKFEEQLKSLNIKFEVNLPKEELLVSGDSYRLEQVFSNLISNAIKYGESSPIKIILTRENNSAVVRVADSGPGIEKKNLLNIFNRFERAISSSEVSGLGLGLFICKEIVELHKGTIGVSSTPGVGTEFKTTLPLTNT